MVIEYDYSLLIFCHIFGRTFFLWCDFNLLDFKRDKHENRIFTFDIESRKLSEVECIITLFIVCNRIEIGVYEICADTFWPLYDSPTLLNHSFPRKSIVPLDTCWTTINMVPRMDMLKPKKPSISAELLVLLYYWL